MKFIKLAATTALIVSCIISNAQDNSVGINTTNPNRNAVLELVSPNSNQGFLVPRVTTTQRISMSALLSNQDNGLMVFDTSERLFYFWSEGVWKAGLGLINNANAGGDLTGSYPNPTIKLGAVVENRIADGAVTTPKIQNSSVTTEKINNGAIVADKISSGAVTTEKISDFAVTGAKLENVPTISAGTYGTDAFNVLELVVDQKGRVTGISEVTIEIGSANIVDGSIQNEDIANGTITISKINTEGNDNSVLTVDGSGNPVWSDRSEFTSSSLNQDNLYIGNSSNVAEGLPVGGDISAQNQGTQIDLQINTDAVGSPEISDGAVTTSEILDGSIQNEDLDKANIPISGFDAANQNVDLGDSQINNLADPTLTQDAATKNYVDTSIDSENDLTEGSILVGDNTNNESELDASADGNILIGNGTTLNSVPVSGDLEINNAGFTDLVAGAVEDDEVDDDLTINGGDIDNTTIDGSSIGSNTPADASFTTINVNNDATISGALDVDGATTLDQVAINTTDGALAVTGNSGVTVTQDASNVALTTTTSGNIDLTAADDINLTGTNINISGSFSPDNLDVDGLTQLDETQINTTDNPMVVTGTNVVNFNNDVGIQVANGTDLNGALDVAGATSLAATGVATNIRGTLDVDEAANFDGNIDAQNGVDVLGGNLNVTNNADVDGTLDVAGATSLAATGVATNVRGTLDVDEAANFDGNIDAQNGVDVLGGNLNVTNNTNVTGALDVDGATTLDQVAINTTDGPLAVTGNSGVTVTQDASNVALTTTTSGNIDLTAADDINLTGTNINISGSFSPDNLDVDGLTQLDETQINTTDNPMVVTGTNVVNFNNDVGIQVANGTDLNGALDVAGATSLAATGVATNIRGTLDVDEAANFDGNIDAQNGVDVLGGNLNVTNNADVDGTLDVAGATSLAATGVATNVRGTLDVDEAANFDGNIDAQNGVDVLGGNLNVTNNTNVTGALDVDGATTLDQVAINTTDGPLAVTGNSGVTVTQDASNVALTTTTSGNIDLTAADDINLTGTNINISGSFSPDNLDVDGLTQLDETQINTTDNPMVVTGTNVVNFNNDVGIQVANGTDLNGALDVAGATSLAATGVATNIRGTLDVDEAANFDGNIDAQNGVDVLGGNLNVTNNADVDGTLDVAGATSLAATGVATNVRGTLDVDEAANFDGNIDAQNGVDVLGGNLNVTNNTNVTGALDVDGATTLDQVAINTTDGPLAVTGNSGVTVTQDASNVALTTTTSGNIDLTAADDINLTGTNINISGSFSPDNLDVDGLTQLDETQINTTDNPMVVTGTNVVNFNNDVGIQVANGTDLNGALDVAGATSLAATGVATNIRGTLDVDEAANFDGNIDAQNGVDVLGGNLNVTNNADVDGTLDVAGATSLAATGVATNVRGTLDVDEAANFDGNIDAQNGVDVLGGNLNVTNNTNVTGALDVDGATTLDQVAINTTDGPLAVTGNSGVTVTQDASNVALTTTTSGNIDLTAADDINLTGTNINISGSFSPDNLDVDGLTQLDETQINTTDNPMVVTGTNVVNFNNDVGIQVANGTDLNGALDVAGATSLAATGVATNIRGTLDVDEAANFDGNIDAQNGVDVLGGNLNVTNNADVDGTLDVAGATSLAATGVATNVRGTLDVDEAANFDGNIDAQNGVDVLGGNLNVTNNTNVTGALDVDGATTLDQVAINTTDGPLAVTGNSGVTVTQDASNVALTTTTSGNIDLTAADDINLTGTNINISGSFSPDNLDVDGLTQLDETQINTTDNPMVVTGTNVVNFNNDVGIQVANGTDLNGALDVAGATSLAATGVATNIRGTLDVDEAANFDGNIDAQNGVDVLGGNLNVTNNADVDGTLDVAGATSLAATGVATNVRGTLDVDEAANFDGNIDAQNGVDVLGGNLNVTNNTNVTGALDVDGATTLDQVAINTTDGPLAVTGNSGVTVTQDASNVALTTTTSGNIDLTAADDINLTGTNINISGSFSPDNLDVDGLTQLDETQINTTDNPMVVTGTNVVNFNNDVGIQVANGTDLNGALDVAGATSLAATGVATNIRGTLDVDEAANFDGNIDAQNGVDVLGGNLNVTNNADVDGTLDVAGATSLAATGVATNVRGTLDVDEAANFDGNIDAQNGVDVLGGNLNVTNNTNVTGALDVDGATTLDQVAINTTDGPLAVTGNSGVTVTQDASNVALTTTTSGNIDLTAADDINLTGTNINISGSFSPDNLDVDGLTQLDETQINTTDNPMVVTGTNVVNFNNDVGIQVANGTDLNGALDVAGATSLAATGVATNIRGTLDVDEAANFDGNIDAQNGVDVLGGNLNVTNNADVDGTLDVAGATSLAATGVATNVRGTLDVDEAANFDGNIDAQNGVDVLGGNLNVTNNTNVTGALDVDGATTLDQVAINTTDGPLAVTGNSGVTVTQDASNVALTTTTSGNIDLTAADDINLTGTNINISGSFSPDNLDVDGLTQLDETQINTTDNPMVVTGTNVVNFNNDVGIQVANGTDLNGALDVAGATSLAATGVATNIRGTLDVDEAANFDGNIDAQNGVDVLGGNLNVTNNADVDGTLDVAGATSLAATGVATNVRGTLDVDEAANFDGNIDAQNGVDVLGGNLNVTNNTNVTGALDVDGATTLDQVAINTTDGPLAVTGNSGVTVTQDASNVALTTTTSGNIDLTAADDINLTGTNINISGSFSPDNLDVDGLTQLDETQINTTDNPMVVTGTNVVNFNNDVGIQVANGTDLNGALDVAGATSLAATGVATNIRGTLDVDEAANFDGNIDAQNGVDVLGGNLNVTNNADVDGTLDVAGATSLAATGVATNVRGTLDVDEAANFDGNIDAQNGVDVLGGNLNVTNNTNVTGALDVDGATTLDQVAINTTDGPLAVTGNSGVTVTQDASNVALTTTTSGNIDLTAADDINLTGTNINISGSFSPDNLDVDGLTQLDETQINTTDNPMVVTGTNVVNFNNDVGIQVANGTDLNGALDVAGATSLAATGVATNIRGTLDVDEAANFDGNIDAQNGVDVLGGNLNVTNNADVDGTLDVAGATSLAATGVATNVRGTLDVDEAANFDGNIDAQNGVDVLGGNLNVTNNTNVTGALDVDGATTLDQVAINTTDGPLAVTGNSGVTVTQDASNVALTTTTSGNIDLTAADDINLTGTNINISGSFSPDNLDVDGLTQLDETQINTTDNPMVVTGTNVVNFNNDVGIQVANGTDLNGALDVAGATSLAATGVATNIRGTLDVDEAANFDGNIDAQNGVDVLGGNLNVTNNADVDGTLDVAGATSLAATGVATNVRGTLDVDEAANFDGNIDAQNGVDVLGGNLNVTNNTNVTGALDVDGATTLDQVAINTTDGPLAVTGNSGVTVTQDASNVALTTTTSGNIDLTAADDINLTGTNINISGSFSPDNLDVDGLTQLDETQINTTDNPMVVTGTNVVNFNNDVGIQVANGTDLNGALDVAGATSLAATGVATNIRGTLDVDEAANFDGNIDAQNGVDVLGGNLNVTNNADVDGTLDVAGATSLAATGVATNVRGTLDVDEAANFDGNIDAQNGVDVLGGNLNVTNNTNVTGALDVDGATTLDQVAINTTDGPLAVTGNSGVTVTQDASNVALTTTTSGNIDLTAADDINLTGTNINISGSFSPDNLDVDGLTQLDETQINTTDNPMVVTGTNVVNFNNDVGIQVANGTDLNGALDVAGATSLAATGVATNIRGTLDVDEAANFDGNIDAQNGVDVLGGNLNVTNNATVGGTLGVTGATTTAGITNTGNVGTGTLSTTGAATLNSAGVTNNLTVGGVTQLNGTNGLQFDAGQNVSEISTDGTLVDNSNTALPTEQAVKTYVDAQVGNQDLQEAYIDGNTITTSLAEGDVVITGTEQLVVSTTNGVDVTNNATVGGTLGVTGATTTAGITNTGNVGTGTLSTTGAATLNSAGITNNATVGGTLGVTGATTTAGITNTGNVGTGTLSTTGAATLNSAGVTNNLTVGGTLGLATGTTVNDISIDGTLVDNSDNSIPTEQAVKTYVDAQVGNQDLQEAYIDGNTITTSLAEGDVVITGTEQLVVSTTNGVDVTNTQP
ncbi:hypothetical protein [Ekhidna sp.]|uniref:hypothetical protein n=1 Tax=Ekhidna sp. TaxID=2608089 RepID=UPI003BAB33DA